MKAIRSVLPGIVVAVMCEALVVSVAHNMLRWPTFGWKLTLFALITGMLIGFMLFKQSGPKPEPPTGNG